MSTQDLEAFLAGRKDTTKCLPAGVDIAFPPAKRLRTEDGGIAGGCLANKELQPSCIGLDTHMMLASLAIIQCTWGSKDLAVSNIVRRLSALPAQSLKAWKGTASHYVSRSVE